MNRWHKLSNELAAESKSQDNASVPTASQDEVLSQLSKILTSSRFQASPRCQSVLQFVVEEALSGNASTLKERTIGVAVFHREAAYDTSSDPVVRVAAGEIRKKLAQYYCEPEHLPELRISLPTGSYSPDFQWPQTETATTPSVIVEAAPAPSEHPGTSAAAPIIAAASHPRHLPRKPLWALAALLLIGACVIFGGLAWKSAHSPLQIFWKPFFASHTPVLIVMGEMQATNVRMDSELARFPFPAEKPGSEDATHMHSMPVLSLEDASAMAEIATLLRGNQSSMNLKVANAVSFRDLQKTPSVLLGGLNNDWTLRISRNLRFHLQQDESANEWWISDQQKPDKRWGDIHVSAHDPRLIDQDYALVARLINSETGQPVLLVGGVTAGGTSAAVKFVSSENALADFMRTAPPGWEYKNCEFLIRSRMIDGQAGPPELLSSAIW